MKEVKEMKKQVLPLFLLLATIILNGCTNGNTAETTPPTPPDTVPDTSATVMPETAAPRTLQNEEYQDGPTISIVKSKEALAADITQAEIETMVRNLLNETEDFNQLIENGQTVVIKPNLVQMKVDSTGELLDQTVNGITTDWRITNAVVNLIREQNPDGRIYIIEGSASGPTSKVMEYFHYTPEYMPNVDDFISLEEDCGDWQDFDSPLITKVSLENGLLHQEYYFNKLLYEADVLISIPCLKTSSGVVVTAGIKNVSLGTPPGNIYGVAADNPSKVNMVSHKISDGELDKWIYDYYLCKPIDYVIVDGLQGFQSGPVPMSGDRKESDKMNMGILLAGHDAVAVDTICALITGWDSQSVGYLNHFNENGIGQGDLSKILVQGSFIDDLRTNFTIHRPDLGGIQITDTTGPALTLQSHTLENNILTIPFETDEEAIKAELYIDGYFQDLLPLPQNDCHFTADLTGLSGSHEITVIVYDRFYNKTQSPLTIEVSQNMP